MQTIILYITNLAALVSLRAMISRQALTVYGGIGLLIGVLLGHAALMLLAIACLYVGIQKPTPTPREDA